MKTTFEDRKNQMRLLTGLIWICCLFWVLPAKAQVLDRNITVQYRNTSLATVLADLRKKYGLAFSFSSSRLPLDRRVNVVATNQPLTSVLEEICQTGEMEYQLVGNVIVLKRKSEKPKKVRPAKVKPAESKNATSSQNAAPANEISGPFASNELIPKPHLETESIPDSGENLDDVEGRLKKAFESENQNLTRNYLSQMDAAMELGDTSMIRQAKSELRQWRASLKKEYDDVKAELQHAFRKWNADTSDQATDSVKKEIPVQVSFVPPLSTNGPENKNRVNQVSFNVLAGYSGGVNGAEFGGMLNLVRGDVQGAQIAGIANLVKGKMEGAQVAGLLNIQQEEMEGAQIAGFANLSGSTRSEALQVAGFMNGLNGDLNGSQMAGFLNLNKGSLHGLQISGFMNQCGGPVDGAQIAGFLNLNQGNLQGPQVAGFLNISSGSAIGTQVAGFMNQSRNLRGVQVAGFLNRAKNVHGSQIGVINLADSISGVQFGLFNFARNGYRRMDLYAADVMRYNATFRMGTRQFHTLFSGGVNPDKKPTWAYGLGFGTILKLHSHLDLHFDALCQQVLDNRDQYTENLNLLNQGKILLAWAPRKRTALFAGPVVHVAVSRVRELETNRINPSFIPSHTYYNQLEGNKTRVAIWLGWNAGIRF